MSHAVAATGTATPVPRWGSTEGTFAPRIDVREKNGEGGLRLPIGSLRTWWQVTNRREAPRAAPLDLALEFLELATKWHEETDDIASAYRTIAHPAYLRVIAKGRPFLPFVLADLRETGALWFPALTAITNLRLGTEEERRSAQVLTELWLEWGRRANLI